MPYKKCCVPVSYISKPGKRAGDDPHNYDSTPGKMI